MLAGDSSPWRDLGHTKLYDPYALYESPISPQFKRAVDTEATFFASALEPVKHALKKTVESFNALLTEAIPERPSEAQETVLWHGHTIYIQHGFGNRLNVWISSAEKQVRAYKDLESFGVDPESDLYYTIADVGDGDQTLQLSVYRIGAGAGAGAGAGTPQYTVSPVGPNAAFKDDYLYYGNIENRLRSNGITCVKKDNGRGSAQVFECEDKRFQVELFAPPRQPDLFIRITNALSMRIALITGATYKWLTPPPSADGRGETLVSVCKTIIATNNALDVEGRTYPYPKGFFLTDAVPLEATKVLLALVKHAVTSLFLFDTEKRTYTALFKGTEPCDAMLHSHSTIPSVTLTNYHAPNIVFEIQGDALIQIKQLPEPVKLVRHAHGTARASDGTTIPYTFVSAVRKPKKLLVIAYGAYGLSSKRAYPKRWLLWLTRGYAIVESAPRGGRENGDAWYDAARTAGRKETTFTDVASVIKAVQERFHFKREQTVIYGRSAGGWTAAYIGQNYSHLVGAVYAEVPYLDVIRTASNPRLPLTQLEYDEFGDPAHRPKEYEALRSLSPVDSVSTAPTAAAFFLVRTALHDSQVYPYEALKFAAKMRSLGWRIVVGMDRAGGHFVKNSSAAQIYAEDFLLIDGALKSRQQATKTRRRQARSKLRSHNARGTTRRRASSRKH
jgi:cephalosporin-C deacetylase-like acetyl esterase